MAGNSDGMVLVRCRWLMWGQTGRAAGRAGGNWRAWRRREPKGDAGFFLMTERAHWDARPSALAASRPLGAAPAPLCPRARTAVAAGESFTIVPIADFGDPSVEDGAARRATALLGVAEELVALDEPVTTQKPLEKVVIHMSIGVSKTQTYPISTAQPRENAVSSARDIQSYRGQA